MYDNNIEAIGLIMAMERRTGSAVERAEAAAQTAVEHSMGVSVSGHKIIFTPAQPAEEVEA